MKNYNGIAQKQVIILGVKVLSTTIASVLAGIRDDISHNLVFTVMTPNPELVLASESNNELRSALNSANFSIPDGNGLHFASKFLYGEPLKVIPGRVLFKQLIELANKKGWKVFFLGGLGKEAETAAGKLKLNYKNIKIETFSGPKLNRDGEPLSDSDKVLQREAFGLINKFAPKLLFVAFGNPKQEIWIHKNLKYLNIGGAMAVGGTLRYIAGMSRLPPRWMEKARLEWIWRLLTEPYRFKRVLTAFPVFPLRIFWFKIFGR